MSFLDSTAVSLRTRPNTTVFTGSERLKLVRCSIAPQTPGTTDIHYVKLLPDENLLRRLVCRQRYPM